MDDQPELTPARVTMMTETLRISLLDAARAADPVRAQALSAAAELLAEHGHDCHPALPPVGTTVVRDLVVEKDDTASSMGHPDPAMAVLGSPRISLWFELVSSEALPHPEDGPTSVGVGILVHHLGKAEVGEKVEVTATVESVSGRRVAFSCTARVGDRLVARGTHQRVLLEAR
ncbi:MAG: thioesterase family protein [Nocardioidaceae bacterium]